ncbi:MAG: hypothetical protein AAF251_02855 [Pseudomonadota bacterium]
MNDVGLGAGRDSQLLSALLIECVQLRSKSGLATTLRDLHELLEEPQPIALRIVHSLEEEGVVTIDRDVLDALASTVEIVPSVANHLLFTTKSGGSSAA